MVIVERKLPERTLEHLGLPHHEIPRLLLDIGMNNIYLYLLFHKANLDFVHSSMSSSPEFQAPPKIYYNDTEARKYTSSSHMVHTQVKISFYLDTANKLQTNNQSFSSYKWKFSVRALELLGLPHHGLPRLLLDISNNNIYLYLLLLKANLDFVHWFRSAGWRVIDGAISISAIQ
ncbi:hypothetical protein GIB67_029006, partial [Kingdonia uniflora]